MSEGKLVSRRHTDLALIFPFISCSDYPNLDHLEQRPQAGNRSYDFLFHRLGSGSLHYVSIR